MSSPRRSLLRAFMASSVGTGLSRVLGLARELALDIAAGVYEPQICEHVPGVANVSPDVLSRWFEPGKSQVLSDALAHAEHVQVAARDSTFWRAAAPPAIKTTNKHRATTGGKRVK